MRKRDTAEHRRNSTAAWMIAAVVFLLSLGLFYPAVHHDFINYDDPDYITNNPHVQGGLTKDGLVWAFGKVAGEATYWHPVTWISHMTDVQFFGVRPAGHHAVNIVLHAIDAVLLFVVLRLATGALWRSAFVAALFAVHPLQVDTVAWVTERKNVLSTMFWLLTMLAYIRHVRVSEVRSRRWLYLGSLGLFAVGLMCKPMLVTLPCVMILMDVWPLQRIQTWKDFTRSILAKIPFFILSAGCALITIQAHKKLGLVASERDLTLIERLINAAVSYVTYFRKTIWPTNLAVYYPIPDGWSVVEISAAVVFLVVAIAAAIWCWRKASFITFGVLWFLGTLVPVIGVLQVGIQSMADRFVYVPLIGLFVATVWGIAAIVERNRLLQNAAVFVGVGGLTAYAAVTTVQLSYWKNSHTLFEHAAKVIPNNVVAEVMLGVALEHEGDLDGALRQYQRALEIKPGFAQMHYDIANILAQQKHLDEAVAEYRAALAINDSYAEFHYNLALVLEMQGKMAEAVPEYEAALKIHPGDVDCLKAVATALVAIGKPHDAEEFFSRAFALQPDDPLLHYDFSKCLGVQNKVDAAIGECERALQLRPDFFEAHFAVGNLLIQRGRRPDGLMHLREAVRLRPDNIEAKRRLAANEQR